MAKSEGATIPLVSVTTSGQPYSHTLLLEPIKDSATGAVRCFQATSHDIKFMSPPPAPVRDEPPAPPRADDMASAEDAAPAEAPTEGGLAPKGTLANTSNIEISAMMDWLA